MNREFANNRMSQLPIVIAGIAYTGQKNGSSLSILPIRIVNSRNDS